MGSSKSQTAISNYAYTLGAAGNRLTVGGWPALREVFPLPKTSMGAPSDFAKGGYHCRKEPLQASRRTITRCSGQPAKFRLLQGVTHAYNYDALNRLTQMGSSKNASAISNYAYKLGLAGNRTSVAELSGRTVAYAYDSLCRLTTETVTADPHSKNGAISFTYARSAIAKP